MSMAEYVKQKGGKNPIEKGSDTGKTRRTHVRVVLIANNGIAAVKAIRSIKR